ncbi:MAG: arsenate reductase (glutaredoxin) [Alphaproteobacteria bacterium GM202ARS2]|nr:arsenate reductase (glutaredoxin) [Alphaproteobacteria bacterium GM202ARS2]
MTQVTIYHNPNCGHSRTALAWLQGNEGKEAGVHDVTVIEYLKKPLSAEQLGDFFERIDTPLMDFMRVGGDVYKELGLQGQHFDNKSMADILSAHPQLMQRPLVFVGKRGLIARDIGKLQAFIEDAQDDE